MRVISLVLEVFLTVDFKAVQMNDIAHTASGVVVAVMSQHRIYLYPSKIKAAVAAVLQRIGSVIMRASGFRVTFSTALWSMLMGHHTKSAAGP